MNDIFLKSLLDTTGNAFFLGKTEKARESVFLQWSKKENNRGTEAYVIIYNGHELNPVHKGPILRNNTTPDWIFPVLLVVLAFFAWTRFYYNRYFLQLLKAFININLTFQIVRDENIFFQRISI
jgi:hypothetical protein